MACQGFLTYFSSRNNMSTRKAIQILGLLTASGALLLTGCKKSSSSNNQAGPAGSTTAGVLGSASYTCPTPLVTDPRKYGFNIRTLCPNPVYNLLTRDVG